MKALIIDDEPDVVEVITLTFKLQWPAWEVISAGDGESGLALFFSQQPDVIILDLALPKMSGFEVCRQIRQASDVPILMLTVKGDEMDKVRGLELGADDYITKPFSPLELLARLRAVLRRVQMPPPTPPIPEFISGDLAIDFSRRQVTLKGQPVKLTPTEYSLLFQLVRNAGHVVPHSTLLAKVWGQEYRDDLDILKVHIGRLREKLGDDAQNPRYIFTQRGVGYYIPSPS